MKTRRRLALLLPLCAALALVTSTSPAKDELETEKLYIEIPNKGEPQRVISQLASAYRFHPETPLHRLRALNSFAVVVRPEAGNISQLLTSLAEDSRVTSAAVVKNFVVAGARGAPSSSELRADQPDPYAPLQYSHDATRVTQAQRFASGRGVKVAVIDTGIDGDHVDLSKRIEKQLNFVSAEQEAGGMEFHATAVAGIIAAERDNGHGIGGVAPEAQLFALRACVESNPGSSRGKCSSVALARAIDWAIINQMDIVNMSVRGQDDQLVTRLISKAFEKGIVVVAATDLVNGQLDFPAKLDQVIAVSDQESNSLVGLAAHSQRIFIAPGEEILTTLPNDTYDFVTGASFAAAHVSGIVALLREKAPGLSPSEVTSVLRSSVRVVNWGILVDSCQALMRLGAASSCQIY